ncbi:FemAB family protein [Formosa sp. 4Alg 33]|uniref:FemAB family protein n=1 Tax=Formosa sp. 4Alg 33 TaxID=3382189 RepID=UPI003D9C1332
MSQLKVERYAVQHFDLWNTFISEAKNGTFLFHRHFMEYHKDRFEDFSLLIYKQDSLIAVIPANRNADSLYSHQGLTFGGLILKQKQSVKDISLIFEALFIFLQKEKFKSFIVKEMPEIYFKTPAFEFSYFLAKQAKLDKREMVLAVDYSKPLTIHKTKLKHFRKAKDIAFEIRESSDFTPFWTDVLQPRLLEKHQVKPVHSLEEITYLNTCFPKNIKQFDVYLDNKILAGLTLFENEHIVKSQYGATTKEGEKHRALDFLFLSLIYKYKAEGKRFFSMGTATEQNRLGYNEGLLKQKEELGCKVYLQDFFKLQLND